MPNTKRLLARRILNAGISASGNLMFPGTGSLVEAIYSVTHPEVIDKEWDDWRQKTNDDLNGIVEAIFPAIRLSETASDVALYLANVSENGRRCSNLYTIEDIHTTLSETSKDEIEDSVGALLHFELLSKGPTVQTMVTPEYPLFWLFDPISNSNTDPYEDAKSLAAKALESDRFISRKIIEELNWSYRRFNPAMAYLIEEIGDAFIISRESNPDMIVVGMHFKTESRFQLRRFINGEA
jgi:hypothetical protein